MSKLNRILFLAVLILFPAGMVNAGKAENQDNAQQSKQTIIKVTGKVVDANTNEPVIGATIVIKGTTIGVITDLDGNFSIDVEDKNAILEISCIGYSKIDIPVGDNTELTIALESRIEELEQVVVIGYGATRKADVVGAISSVNSKEINNLITTNVSQAIQGRAAGVEVINSSGAPGASVKIKVRGTGTINNSDPLYVVDGFIVENINSLNPEDIKDFQILKDASSSAIYGARAANGVVLITTKRGEKGDVKYIFSANFGISEMWKVPERTNKEQYLELYEEYAGNSYFVDNPSVKDRVIFEQYGVENWLDYIYRNGVTEKYNLQVSGGNENNSFLISATWADEKGIFITSHNNKRSVRINIDNKLNQFMTLRSGVAYTANDNRLIEEDDVFKNTFNRAPSLPYYNRDYIFVDESGDVIKDYKITFGDHVYDKINRRIITGKSTQYNGNFNLETRILNGLTSNTRVGYDMEFFQGLRAWKADGSMDNYNPNTGGFTVNQQEKKSKYKWQAEEIISYAKTINEHNVLLLSGISLEGYKEEFTWHEELGAPANDPGSSASDANYRNALVTGASKGWSSMGIPARFDYNYLHKYYFQVNFRADASSKFRPDQRWGYFPSLSAGWTISEEEFMKPVGSWLSQLKLRVNWGKSGNNRIADYSAYTLIKSSSSNSVLFGRTNLVYRQGWAPESYGNPTISWEKTTGSNIGLDFTLFEGNISGSMEVFEKTTSDMLLQLPLPLSLGLDKDKNPWQNAGSVKNTGYELMLTYRKVLGNFSVDIRGNFSQIYNKVTKLGEEGNPVLGGYYDIGRTDGINQTYVTYTAVGMPIGMFYGYKIDRSKHSNGIWHTSDSEDGTVIPASAGAMPEGSVKPGDFIFVDMNGDGIINDYDKTYLGSPHPKALYGLNISLQYKNIDFTAFFQGVYGNKLFNTMRYYSHTFHDNSVVPELYGESWKADVNEEAKYPRITNQFVDNNNYRISDFYIEDGSYMRLKNIQLGYIVPKKWIGKVKMKNLRVAIGATNLFTLTNYTGFDPEVGADEGYNRPLGIDKGVYPQNRTFLGSITIDF